MRTMLCLAALLAAAAIGPAGATALRSGTATPPAKGKAPPPAATASASADAPTLIEGHVTAVDRVHRTMTVNGRQVEWHASKLQLFHAQGGRVGPDAVQPGARVRFALAPGSGEGRKIVLVYLEAAR